MIGDRKPQPPRRPTLTELRAIREPLARALEDGRTFGDPLNSLSDLPADLREQVAPYLQTWVLGPVADAVRLIDRILENSEPDHGR